MTLARYAHEMLSRCPCEQKRGAAFLIGGLVLTRDVDIKLRARERMRVVVSWEMLFFSGCRWRTSGERGGGVDVSGGNYGQSESASV